MQRSTIWIFSLLLLLSQMMASAQSKIIRRAFFDIGSGSTKMVVADVDVEKNTLQVLHEEAEKVSYKLDLETSTNNEFSASIQEKALLVLAKMKWTAIQKGAKEFVGVATSAFRTAKNGKDFASFLSQVLGIPVAIVSQKEEAILGFIAAVQQETTSLENIVVWDIGGGSMQITMLSAPGQYEIYGGDLASVSFSRYLIEEIQGRKITEVQSPNPILEKECEKGLEYVRLYAKEVPEIFRKKIAQPNTLVLGIGGVHFYSVRAQTTRKEEYNQEILEKILQYKLGKNDKEIGGKFAATEVSNLILVLGYMQSLGIKSVKTKDINIAHGVLLYQALWK